MVCRLDNIVLPHYGVAEKKLSAAAKGDGARPVPSATHRCCAEAPCGRLSARLFFPRLKDRTNQLGGTLPGAEQQMLAVGRALMSKGKILLRDEPSIGLAAVIAREIFRVLAEINQAGITVLLVEQKANMVLRVAYRSYVLEIGPIALSDTEQELMGNPKAGEAYWGG